MQKHRFFAGRVFISFNYHTHYFVGGPCTNVAARACYLLARWTMLILTRCFCCTFLFLALSSCDSAIVDLPDSESNSSLSDDELYGPTGDAEYSEPLFGAARAHLVIEGPNQTLSYGDLITENEIQKYDSWYTTYKEDQKIYSDASAASGGGWSDNRSKKWAWSGSYLMSSLLNMHRMTARTCDDSNGQTPYLKEFKKHVDYIMSKRETVRPDGKPGYLMGRTVNSWAQSFTSDTGETVYVGNLVQTMMILEPITEAAYYIISTPLIANQYYCGSTRETFRDVAKQWIADALHTLDDYMPHTIAGREVFDAEIQKSWIGNGQVKGFANETMFPFEEGWSFRFPDVDEFENISNLVGKPSSKKR